MNNEPLIQATDLTIKYETSSEDIVAVSDATFTINQGEYFGLVGESGCGKSTLAKSIIGGLDSNGYVDSGELLYRGTDISNMSEQELNKEIRWKEISFIPQSSMDNLDPLRRINEQAIELAEVHTDFSRQEALNQFEEMFEIVGISPERITDYPHQFSGGMQQRAIIALSLFLKPSVVIADEPTTALDVIMQDQIFKYLDQIRDDLQMSMLLITHDISLVFESCDRMAVMHAGQIAEAGHVTDVYDEPRHPYSILLQEAFPDVRNPNKELKIIEGKPPQHLGEVASCSFVERCPWSTEDCRAAAPPAEEVEPNHVVSCIHANRVYEDRYSPQEEADD